MILVLGLLGAGIYNSDGIGAISNNDVSRYGRRRNGLCLGNEHLGDMKITTLETEEAEMIGMVGWIGYM